VGADGKGQLGGDPLRDVVLAEAMLQGEPSALAAFSREYRQFAVGQAAKLQPRFRSDDDWWHDLLTELQGQLKPPGKLARFHGRCSLRNWLGTVVRNFLYTRISQSTREGAHTVPIDADDGREIGAGDEGPEQILISRECHDLLAQRVRQALDILDAEAAALLQLLFVEQLPGKEIAGLLGIHPGNVTRRKEQALRSLESALRENPTRSEAFAACLEHLLATDGRRDFAAALFDALAVKEVLVPA
jgi:RNA polymerase sigma factor (sigma-70 family)